MDPFTLGLGAATLIGNIASNVFANKTNVNLARENREYNKSIMLYQNEYNTPESQMQRYREAGLNPMLVYGQMGRSFSADFTSTAPGQVQAPTFDLGAFFEARRLDQQQQVIDADTELKNAEKELKDEQILTERVRRDNIAADTDNKTSETSLKQQLYEFNNVVNSIEVDFKKLDYSHRKALNPILELNAMLQNDHIRSQLATEEVARAMQQLLGGANYANILSNTRLNRQQADFLDVVNDFRMLEEQAKAQKGAFDLERYEDINKNKFLGETTKIFKYINDFIIPTLIKFK